MRDVKRVSSLILVLILTFNLTSVAVRLAFAEGAFRVARVRSFKGTVKIMKSGGEKSFDAFEGMSLTEGDSITTEGNSCVVLDIDDDKEVKIGENSMVNLSQLSGLVESGSDQTVISLWVGKIWTNIRKGLNIRAKYEIKVPTAIIGVRGTQFAVEYGRGQNDISVFEGEVLATKFVPGEPDSNGQNVIDQFEFIIRANEQAQFNDSDRSVEDVEVNEVTAQSLSLFVLEILKEYIEQDPSSVNPEIAKAIDEQIEIKTMEVGAIKQEQGEVILERRVEVDPVVDAPESPAPVTQDEGWYDEPAPVVDTTPPEFVSGYPTVGDIGPNSVELMLRANEDSQAYFVILEESDAAGNAPQTSQDIIQWVEEPGTHQVMSWSGALRVSSLNQDIGTSIDGFSGSTDYVIYITLKDAAGNISQQITILRATTDVDTIPPRFETGYPQVGDVGSNSIELSLKVSEESNAHIVMLKESEIGNSAPKSVEEVLQWPSLYYLNYRGWSRISVAPIQSLDERKLVETYLQAGTAYRFYIALTDSSGNVSGDFMTVDVTTLPGVDNEKPAFETGYPEIVEISSDSMQISYKSNEEADAYFVIVKESEIGDKGPKSAEEVIEWVESINLDYDGWRKCGKAFSVPYGGRTYIYGNLLGSTAYKVYVALKDPSGNVSDDFEVLSVVTLPETIPPLFEGGYPRVLVYSIDGASDEQYDRGKREMLVEFDGLGEKVDIALIQSGGYNPEEGRFDDVDKNGFADGLGAIRQAGDQDYPVIEEINNNRIAPATYVYDVTIPSSPFTVSIDSEDYNYNVRLVVYQDANRNDKLDLDAEGKPIEKYAVSGVTGWIKSEADNGILEGTVAMVLDDADMFTLEDGTACFYESNDVFRYQGVYITKEDFEKIICDGDYIDIVYSTGTSEESVFDIIECYGFQAPEYISIATVNKDSGSNLNDVEISFTAPDNNENAVYIIQRAALVGPDGIAYTADDLLLQDPNLPWITVGSITKNELPFYDMNVPDGTYSYRVVVINPVSGVHKSINYEEIVHIPIVDQVDPIILWSSIKDNGYLGELDEGDILYMLFSDVMSIENGDVIRITESLGENYVHIVLGNGSEFVTETRGSQTLLTVTLTADPIVQSWEQGGDTVMMFGADGSSPLEIINSSGITDLSGNSLNLSTGDVLLESDIVSPRIISAMNPDNYDESPKAGDTSFSIKFNEPISRVMAGDKARYRVNIDGSQIPIVMVQLSTGIGDAWTVVTIYLIEPLGRNTRLIYDISDLAENSGSSEFQIIE